MRTITAKFYAGQTLVRQDCFSADLPDNTQTLGLRFEMPLLDAPGITHCVIELEEGGDE